MWPEINTKWVYMYGARSSNKINYFPWLNFLLLSLIAVSFYTSVFSHQLNGLNFDCFRCVVLYVAEERDGSTDDVKARREWDIVSTKVIPIAFFCRVNPRRHRILSVSSSLSAFSFPRGSLQIVYGGKWWEIGNTMKIMKMHRHRKNRRKEAGNWGKSKWKW